MPKVIQLGRCRDLLSRWAEVRRQIKEDDLEGFILAVRDRHGQEVLFVAGSYDEEPKGVLRLALKIAGRMVGPHGETPARAA